MVVSDITTCEAEGFRVTPMPAKGLVDEAEVARDGVILGLACPLDGQAGYYAVDAAGKRLDGEFPTLVEACRALAAHSGD